MNVRSKNKEASGPKSREYKEASGPKPREYNV
jgi:hypothetical protein